MISHELKREQQRNRERGIYIYIISIWHSFIVQILVIIIKSKRENIF